MAANKEDDFPWTGMDSFIDSREKVKDFDGSTKLNLFSGRYFMVGYESSVMIRKGPEIRKETYDLLRNFQHNSAIPLLNFYPDPPNNRFIIPKVSGSFEVWIKTLGKTLLFDDMGKMSALFRIMICDMCDVVEKLHKINLKIKNFNLKNLYMAVEDSPRLLLLLTEVEPCTSKTVKGENWTSVKDVIEWCCQQCGVNLNYLSKKFVGFIGSEKFKVTSLKNYPDRWNYETKREYLMQLIATNQDDIKKAVNKTDLKWPILDGKRQLPGLLQQIVDHHLGKSRSYPLTAAFNYVMLIRNSYKHYDELPETVKSECGGKEGFLRMVEHWTPDFWIHLYDIIGWL